MKTGWVVSLILISSTAIAAYAGGKAAKNEPAGTAPQVISVNDAGGARITNGTTNVNFSSIVITFDRPMNAESVAMQGNISVSCAGAKAPVISVAPYSSDGANGITGDEYEIFVGDAYKFQLMSCRLVAGKDIVAGDGAGLKEDAAYQFENGCAVSDDFNVSSSECWAVRGGAKIAGWHEMLSEGVLFFDSGKSALDIGGGKSAVLYKPVRVNGQGFEITLHAGPYATRAGEGPDSSILIGLANKNDISEFIGFGLVGSDKSPAGCFALNIGEDSRTYCPPAQSAGRYFRLCADGETVSAMISEDGVNYEELPFGDKIAGANYAALSELILSVTGRQPEGGTSIDSIVVEGITVSGQYN